MLGLLVKAAVGLAVVGGGTAATIATVSAVTTDTGTVTHLVDGDTVDVLVEGVVQRVRLLNIDTPETVDPEKPVECLGLEASAHLASLIPVGSQISLRYDDERIDGYGRTLAAVYADDVLVNAEMARAGLGVPVMYGENDAYLSEVEEAATEAEANGRGLYPPEITCTIPGQVATAEAAAAGAPTAVQPAGSTAAQLDTLAAQADAPIAQAAAFLSFAGGDRSGIAWAAFDRAGQDRLVGRVVHAVDRARNDQSSLRTAADDARAREKAEADRRAAEQAAREQADREQAAREKAAREQAARDKAAADRAARDRASAPSGTSSSGPRAGTPGSSGSTAQNPYPGYTGPRCYAPGGKTWKPC
ncbi:hypothetical protein GCM10023215_09260 [Pseudonocardia yuanmonensis]|uniref:TNase-like domain-containing protein n=1 Tax=Pseudonocardia yuanmonensis TaxID=1095914 RepID=A0ABP8W230_9PSEU